MCAGQVVHGGPSYQLEGAARVARTSSRCVWPPTHARCGESSVSPGRVLSYAGNVRAFIVSVIEELVSRHHLTTRIDLNDIAEAIGDHAVTYDEVDRIIVELEARGCTVGGEPSVRELALIREVLTAARALEAALGRRPRAEEIALAIDQPVFVVRRAVENASMLARHGT